MHTLMQTLMDAYSDADIEQRVFWLLPKMLHMGLHSI